MVFEPCAFFGTGTHDQISSPDDRDEIIGNKAMPSFNEVECAFALASTWFSDKQKTHSIYIDERALYACGGCEHEVQVCGETMNERCR